MRIIADSVENKSKREHRIIGSTDAGRASVRKVVEENATCAKAMSMMIAEARKDGVARDHNSRRLPQFP